MFRSSYDQQLQRLFDTSQENYNAPPWPATQAPQFRTRYDSAVQKHWCPNCRENFEPLTGFRTKYDLALQQHWCPKCNGGSQPSPPLGKFSYACSPGLGCHLLHQAPGSGPSGVRYSNKQACEAKCAKAPGGHDWCAGLQHSECDQRHPACVWKGTYGGAGKCEKA